MVDGQYIKNNTLFCKPEKKGKYDRFIENIIFIHSDNLNQDIKNLFNEKDINTIRLTDDYKLDNLDFLNKYDLSFIKSIDILSDSVTNIEGVYNLKNLEEVNSVNLNIDYTKLPNLKAICGELSAFSYKTLSELRNLEKIIIEKFNKPDLSILANNKNLKSIAFSRSKLKSIAGLENFLELELLNLYENRSLISLEGIGEKHLKLKEIIIYSASKLFDVNSYLSLLPQLETLQLDSKLVDSVKFLDSLNNLKHLSMHNLILGVDDGDKTPLINALKRTGSKIW